MTSTAKFITVFGLTEDQNVIKTAVAAVREGYAVIPLPPGEKKPGACWLTSAEKKALGPHRNECGVHHAITEPEKARSVFTRLQKAYEAPIGLGVVAYPSRLIVVDADHAEAVEAFLKFWAEKDDDSRALYRTPTVRTPGMKDNDGAWVHKDGGHFYFRVPDDVVLPLGRQVLKMAGGFDIRWGWSMTAVPPTRRSEGPYVATGNVLDAPAWMVEAILENTERLVEKQTYWEGLYANDPIAKWSQSVTWAELLEEDGWSDTSKTDSCGCPIFEKPGGGTTSWKSATGHNNICDQYPNVEGHGPLHLWTTEPPAPLDVYVQDHGQTITKLSYVALTQFDNDVAAAKIALGIEDPVAFDEWVGGMTGVTTVTEEPITPITNGSVIGVTSVIEGSVTEITEREAECDGSPAPRGVEPSHFSEDSSSLVTATSEEEPAESVIEGPSHFSPVTPEPFLAAEMEALHVPAKDLDTVKVAMKKQLVDRAAKNAVDAYVRALSSNSEVSLEEDLDIIDTEGWDDSVDLVPELLHRTDGRSLFHRGRVNYAFGKQGAGKTWLAMLTTIQALEEGLKVIYFDFEDNKKLFRSRGHAVGFDFIPYIESGQLKYRQEFERNDILIPGWVAKVGEADLVVFDVINRMIIRLGGNPDVGNEEAAHLTDRIFDPIAALDTCVLVLDHPNKKGQAADATVDDLKPGGGAMKLNNANGHVVGLKPVKPFSQQTNSGTVDLVCVKDRTGNFTEGERCGVLVGEPEIHEANAKTYPGLRVFVNPPGEVKPRTIQDDLSDTKKRLLSLLGELGPMTKGQFASKVTPALRPYVDVALPALVDEGLVVLVDKRYSLPAV